MKQVYLLKAGDSTYKVGITSNVLDRVRAIQTSNADTIKVVATVPVSDPRQAEKLLHMWLENYKADGGQEWFSLEPDKVVELLIKMNAMPGTEYSGYLSLRNAVYKIGLLEKRIDEINKLLKQNDAPPITRFQQNKDDQINEAINLIRSSRRASASFLQVRMNVGYARATNIIDVLEKRGIVGPPNGAKPRTILVY